MVGNLTCRQTENHNRRDLSVFMLEAAQSAFVAAAASVREPTLRALGRKTEDSEVDAN